MKLVVKASMILTEYILLWMVKHLPFFWQCRNNQPYRSLYEGRTEKNRGVRTLRCSRGRHVRVFPLLRTLKQILYCDPNRSFLKNESVVSDARLRLYQYFPR